MGNPTPLIESENIVYEIIIRSLPLGIPFDGFSLTNAMVERGYIFEQNSGEEIAIAKKQDSTITFNTQNSAISIQDGDVEKIVSTVKEMLDILKNECEFDLGKYQIIHKITNTMIVKTGFNPLESMTKSFAKDIKSKINSLYEDNFKVDGFQLASGDRYGNNFHNLNIAPRYSRDSTTYYIIYTQRDTDMKIIMDSMKNSRNKILHTLKILDES